LSKKQFQAKTRWVVALGPYEMVRGDQKDFCCGPWKFGISVLEVTDTTQVMMVARDILSELRLLKKEKALVDDDDSDTPTIDRTLELDFAFLFVVNIVAELSTLLIAGGRELALAKAAFLENPDINDDGGTSVTLHSAAPDIRPPGSTIRPDETAMTLPKGYVSRKAQFVPAFFQAVQKRVDLGKNYNKNNNDDDVNDDDDNSSSERTNDSKLGRNSLHSSYRSNALQASICQEDLEDEHLVSVNREYVMKNNGNLYDDHGRVTRIYS